jgi:hypothetical protein
MGFVNGKLDLSSSTAAYANLVGVAAQGTACGTSGLTRVVAGHSAESLLYDKVLSKTTATPAPCGTPMPENMPALSTADVALIQEWIDSGANP